MNKAIQFWAVSFVLLFVLFQLLDWLQQVTIPYPIFVGAGAVLATFSNANKSFGFLSGKQSWLRLK